MTTELRYLGSYGYRIQQAHGPCDPLTGPRIDGPHRARYQYHRHNRHTMQRYKVRTDNITVRTTMRPHRYLQVLVPDSACTWPMHPTTAPWGEGPHQLRYKYHTQNRDTHEPRTDNRTQDCEIAVLRTQHRYLRLPDSAHSRSTRPSTRPPGSTVRIGHTSTVPHREQTCARAKTH